MTLSDLIIESLGEVTRLELELKLQQEDKQEMTPRFIASMARLYAFKELIRKMDAVNHAPKSVVMQ